MNKIVVLGAKGMLGGELMKVFGNGAVGWDRGEADITEFENLKFKIQNLKPAAVINCAAFNDVDTAETRQDLVFRLNAEAVKNLAKISEGLNIPLVHFSTNYVFDGEKGEYTESDQPNPQSAYAKSKYQGELELRKNCKKYYLIRTAVLFGPKGESGASKKSFVELILDKSAKNDTIKAVYDQVNSVTYAKDLAAAVKQLLDKNYPYGIYHLANSGRASWYDFAREIFHITGKDAKIIPVASSEFPRPAPRPQKSVLANTKFPALRPWQEALKEFLNQEL